MKLVELTAAGKCIGESHGNAKLTYAKVEELRRLRAEGWSFARLAKHFGVCTEAARKAAIGATWATPPARIHHRADGEEFERVERAVLTVGVGINNIARSLGVTRSSVLKIMRKHGLKGDYHRCTVCQRGHPLVGDNIYITPDGRRQCRACRTAQSKKKRRKHAKNRGGE